MGNLFTKPLGVLIGMLYPAYQSFKALESPGIDDDKQWLTYWCVHSFLQVFEYFGEYILTGTIPFYYLVKLVFLVYLMHPQYRGALACYANFVAPYGLKPGDVMETLTVSAEGINDFIVTRLNDTMLTILKKRPLTVTYRSSGNTEMVQQAGSPYPIQATANSNANGNTNTGMRRYSITYFHEQPKLGQKLEKNLFTNDYVFNTHVSCQIFF